MMLDANPLTRIEAPQASTKHAACGRYWAVVQTHPQAETWACSNLRRAGFDVYLPTLFISRRDRHTPTIIHRIERPLFTSYAFIHLDTADPWTPVRYASGVRQLLMSSGKPAKLPEAILRAVQAGEAFRRLPTPDTVILRPGAAVSIAHGPFQGHDAVVIAAATNTARIALPMLGALRELTVPIACLTARD